MTEDLKKYVIFFDEDVFKQDGGECSIKLEYWKMNVILNELKKIINSHIVTHPDFVHTSSSLEQ